MNEWVKRLRSSVQSVVDGKRRKSAASPSKADHKHNTATGRPHTVSPELELPPAEPPQLAGLTKQRARGPPRRRPSPRGEQQRTVSCPPADADPARRQRASSCRDLVYEYSSSGEDSDGSEQAWRPSTRQQLNTAMSETVLPSVRRSASPAPQAATRASHIYQQRAGAAAPRQAAAPCLARRSRASVPSLMAPRRELEREFGGGSSTGSSSLSNLTSTLTRQGQMLPVLLNGLERASLGLRQCSAREAGLAGRLAAAEGNLATARADISRLQDKVTSLQIVVATTSSKMMAFTEMFQTVDEQLRDMWSEMESVNSSVHRVMHRSAEHQRQNERLFSQLEVMRDRLMACPPGGAAVAGRRAAGAAPSPEGRAERAATEGPAGQPEMDISGVEDPLSRTLVI